MREQGDQERRRPDDDVGREDATDAQLAAEVDAELAAEAGARRRAPARTVGLVLLIGSLVSWAAAVTLLVEKLHLLAHPGASLVCDINPFISCGSVMMTWQASAFGIPNMAIGLAGYAIMGAAGSLLIARAPLPTWFRWAVLGGLAFAFAFIHFLAISAIFVIHALCPWCMVVWVMTAPMFFAALAQMVEDGLLRVPAGLAGVLRHWVLLTTLWYLLVLVTIFLAFMPQWFALL